MVSAQTLGLGVREQGAGGSKASRDRQGAEDVKGMNW